MTDEQRRKQEKKAKQFAELLAGGAPLGSAGRTGSLDEIPLHLKSLMRLPPDANECLEQGHLQDQPEPVSRSTPSEALGRLPPMNLIK